jgi:hypothetical protein
MKTPLIIAVVALMTCLAQPAASQTPSVQDLEENPSDAFPAPPLPELPPPPAASAAPPPAGPPATTDIVVPGPSVTVTCVAPPCQARPAVRISDPDVPRLKPVPMSARYGIPLDSNWRRIKKLGLGLDIMGPAYTIGVTAHWNISYLFGLSATFGFAGPQVITVQARVMPLDGKWTPYVAVGASFLLNPGFGKHDDYMASMECSDPYGGGCAQVSHKQTGDDFLFKGRNILPSVEVGAMVITHRGFSAQLGVTFYINDKYKDAYDLVTIPWPKIGLSWYF